MAIVFPGLTLSGVGFSSPIVPYQTKGTIIGELTGQSITSLGVLATLSAGAILTWSLQVSNDNPQKLVNWLDNPLVSMLTVPVYTQILFPVSAIRLAVYAWTSGSINVGVTQWP